MNKDEVIVQLKRDFATWGAEAAIAALTLHFPFLRVPFIRAFSKWIAGLILEQLSEEFDLASYFLFKQVTNKRDAVAYQDSVRSYRLAVAKGDPVEIARLQAIKNSAFVRIAKFNS